MIKVLCDLNKASDGGSWTIIQRRGSNLQTRNVERTNFYRNWTDYEKGFGSLDGDYWLGM